MNPKRIFKKSLLAIGVVNAINTQPALAAFIGVNDTCTIKQAITSANLNAVAEGSSCVSGEVGADVILMPNQTINMSNPIDGDNIFLIDSNITIQAAQHFRLNGSTNSRLFKVSENAELTIRNATLSGASIISEDADNTKNGAIIFSEGGDVQLDSVTIANGRVTRTEYIDAKGGGVFMKGGTLTIERSLLVNNSAGSGGALGLTDGAILNTSQSYFGLNSARFSGGAIHQTGDLTQINLEASNLRENTAIGRGGAIHAEGGRVSINGGNLKLNESPFGAGAIESTDAEIILDSVDLSYNQSGLRGGAIAATGTSAITIMNSSLTINRSTFPVTDIEGGAIYLSSSEASNATHSILNSTISNNTAATGGAILFSSESADTELNIVHSTIVARRGSESNEISVKKLGSVNLINSIVTENGYLTSLIPTEGPNQALCYIEPTANIDSNSNITADGSCGGVATGAPEITELFRTQGDRLLVGGSETLYIFPQIWNNMTVFSPRYHTPIFGSPVLDASTDSACSLSVARLDQRGRSRPADACDVGAIEAKSATINVDDRCDLQNAIISVNEGSESSDFYDCEDGGDLNTIRFMPNAIQNGIPNTGFYDPILNSEAMVSRPTRVLGIGKKRMNIRSNGPIGSTSSGWIELRDLTIDLNSGVEIDGYGNLQNLDVVNVLNSGISVTGSAKINSTSINNNGIGVEVDGGRAIVLNSAITENAQEGNFSPAASGLKISNMGFVALLNSTVSGNISVGNGAGVNVENSSLTVVNSTIVGNTSTIDGGGISVKNTINAEMAAKTNVRLLNTIISGNSAGEDGDELWIEQFGTKEVDVLIDGSVFGDSGKSFNDALHDPFSLINFGEKNIVVTATDQSSGSNPLSLSLDKIVKPLRLNGGETKTHELADSSPAENAGQQSLCDTPFFGFTFSLDQRGRPRNDKVCDIGSFENIDDDFCSVIALPDKRAVLFCI